MHEFTKLTVWQRAIDLAVRVHGITKDFPKREVYGLCSQMNRAADSISSNIAEGAGRNSRKDFINFLAIANGSSYELFSQVVIAKKLQYIAPELAQPLLQEIDEIQKMNYRLQGYFKKEIK